MSYNTLFLEKTVFTHVGIKQFLVFDYFLVGTIKNSDKTEYIFIKHNKLKCQSVVS